MKCSLIITTYIYTTAQIGDQCWFSENCRYLSEISAVNEESIIDPHYYVYDYDGTDTQAAKSSIQYETYGVLYNWAAVINGNICPNGWHIPSDTEWMILETSLGMSDSESQSTDWRGTDQGYQMKSMNGWYNNENGSNSSEFDGIPGGYRYSGGFSNEEYSGYWWANTELN